MAINRDRVLEAAQKFVEKKKYDRAVSEYQKLIEADPNDARTLLKIGDLQAKQGLHAEAISTYESVGKLYAHQGFALKAIAVYKQIREIIAKHVPHLEERYGHITPKLAELYQQLGLTSDALAALDEVATRLQRQQRDPEAIEVFRRIVELDPTNPLPHLRLAEALSRIRDTEGAVFEFKTAASQLAGIGRRDDALKVLERLLHHKPDAEQARICAELYLSRGQPQDGMQALSKLQICFQANPRDFDTLSLLARAFNAIGQGPKAIEVQKEMARVARDAGKPDLFREIVSRLVRVAPHDDGVRKLAQQAETIGIAAATSGSAAHAIPITHGSAPHAPPGYAHAQRPGPNAYGPQAGQAQHQAQGPHQGRPQPNAPQPHAYGQQNRPMSLPRPMTAAQFPPAEPELEEVEELSYEDVSAVEVLDEVEQADEYENPVAYADAAGNEAAAGGYRGATYELPDYDENDPQAIEAYEAGGAHAAPYDRVADAISAGYDVTDHVNKALADANSYRRVRLYHKALEALRVGLEADPRSLDIHEVYRDILIEAGETDDAVQEMLLIASLYIDSLDGESAARALQDVLAFDPQNARAIEMLQELGYEIVDENEEGEPTGTQAAYDQEHHQAQLPSYDLEEMGAADVSPQYADERQVYIGRAGGRAEGDDALPSFPLDEPDADLPPPPYSEEVAREHAAHAQGEAHQDVHAYGDTQHAAPGEYAESPHGHPEYAEGAPGAPAYADDRYSEEEYGTHQYGQQADAEEQAKPEAAPAHVAPVANIGAAASGELEDALDEAEFFCSRGLFDDARAILAEQLVKHPNNPLLRERIAELDAQDVHGESGARERPREEERPYDITASLDALENLDYDGLEPAEGHAAPDQQVDVEEVFAKFKEGVAKQISADDSDSHYNLGIAYKEMMLLDDAIREFAQAAQDPNRECVCHSMIGMIEIERGRVNEAIDAFLLGLNAPHKDAQQETVLCYEIGAAYEAKKMNKDALSYYQKAMRRDPNYRDVQERVRRLAKNEPKQPIRQVAVGADDEFDRAFDDLVSKA